MERFAEALRECGILWLVFSILDRLVAGSLTAAWVLSNVSVSIAMWLFGIYIERRNKR